MARASKLAPVVKKKYTSKLGPNLDRPLESFMYKPPSVYANAATKTMIRYIEHLPSIHEYTTVNTVKIAYFG